MLKFVKIIGQQDVSLNRYLETVFGRKQVLEQGLLIHCAQGACITKSLIIYQ